MQRHGTILFALASLVFLGLGGCGIGSMTGDGGVGALNCQNYCNMVMQNCTGQNSQFQGQNDCTAFCTSLNVGLMGDTSNDTLACRMQAAQTAQNNPASCLVAGPSGGSQCGVYCQNYCNRVGNCSAFNDPNTGLMGPLYVDNTECMTTCAGFATFSANPLMDDTVQCRIAQLVRAGGPNPNAANTYCSAAGFEPINPCFPQQAP